MVVPALTGALSGGIQDEEPARLTLLGEAAKRVTSVLVRSVECLPAVVQGAVGLDGSPPGYLFRPGRDSGANKWLLHLMGRG